MTVNPPWRDREIRTWPRDMVLLSIGNRKGKSAGFAPGRFHLKTFQTFSHGQFHITIFVLRVGMWNRVWETHHRVLNDFKHSQIDQAYPIGQEKIQSDKAITACKSAEGGKNLKVQHYCYIYLYCQFVIAQFNANMENGLTVHTSPWSRGFALYTLSSIAILAVRIAVHECDFGNLQSGRRSTLIKNKIKYNWIFVFLFDQGWPTTA